MKRGIGDIVFKNLFPLWQRLGFHITRNHFYQPIPDTRTLPAKFWQRHSDLAGIDMNEKKQLQLLADFVKRFKPEYSSIPLSRNDTTQPHDYFINNGAFESVDGEVLYCMIRHFRPKKIFEIGSGFSTRLSAMAGLKNGQDGDPCQLKAFEPYPKRFLRKGFPGLSELIQQRIQDVPLSEFDRLEANDILFIDSSHVLKIGSDVQYLYLEVLPRLKNGVVVHIHDIFMPAEYPRSWIFRDYHFWTEQYLLQAFLMFNRAFEVLWAGNFMNLNHPDLLESAFPTYIRGKRSLGSFWMRKTL